VFKTLRLKAAFGVVALAALVMFSLAGCTAFLDFFTPKGTVAGTVWDATTGTGISGVSVTVVGHSGFSDTTGSTGEFSFEVPAGSLTLHFAATPATSYDFTNVSVTVVGGETTTVPLGETSGNPPLAAGSYRFVLTWGELPHDLDSHLITPNGQHVYFNDPTPTGAGANLDVDDTLSYGPETITITSVQTGTYTYYIYNYSGSPDITTSGAQVRFYNSSGLAQTFTIPTTGTDRYWMVCTLNGATGAVTATNTISATDPAAGLPDVAPAAKISK
jgi:hypothetical protein